MFVVSLRLSESFFCQNDIYLSLSFSLMLFNNEVLLKVPCFFHKCENPNSIKAFLTKFNNGDLSHLVLNWSRFAFNITESRFEEVVCN